jgi:sigma-B regulation protein RsbU (phosphoserine phosphatase)
MESTLSEPPLDIIVAEDEAITRYRLIASLEEMGHTVRAFSDGLKAWEAFEKQPARVIISDWEMPGLTGPEFCQRVRTAERRDYTYFILVTAMKTGDIDYQIASDAGTDDFLMKPLTTDSLWRRLRVAKRILGFNKEIGQLKELIPICAYCRQVREDDDYWSTIEHYIQEHTRSKFSHGICPQCYAKVMRDFEKEKAESAAGREHTCTH